MQGKSGRFPPPITTADQSRRLTSIQVLGLRLFTSQGADMLRVWPPADGGVRRPTNTTALASAATPWPTAQAPGLTPLPAVG